MKKTMLTLTLSLACFIPINLCTGNCLSSGAKKSNNQKISPQNNSNNTANPSFHPITSRRDNQTNNSDNTARNQHLSYNYNTSNFSYHEEVQNHDDDEYVPNSDDENSFKLIATCALDNGITRNKYKRDNLILEILKTSNGTIKETRCYMDEEEKEDK